MAIFELYGYYLPISEPMVSLTSALRRLIGLSVRVMCSELSVIFDT